MTMLLKYVNGTLLNIIYVIAFIVKHTHVMVRI